jgi:hypothetical protein
MHRDPSITVKIYHPFIVVPGEEVDTLQFLPPDSPEYVVWFRGCQLEDADELEARTAVEDLVLGPDDFSIRRWEQKSDYAINNVGIFVTKGHLGKVFSMIGYPPTTLSARKTDCGGCVVAWHSYIPPSSSPTDRRRRFQF